ncbi:MAG: [acyl-carrier-protein] S-malonyltransferase [Candidatus Thermofonsia Clade 1 bacterium]|uniref:Malonyl CoA-acyl carrier protein transacylase n=1 Tax=Candidatus Thermofonsia Clade 1 bacterium TaxID=2364210 RepID=A0A2M8P2M5_9CHLR|nr:MAG: [acyl-carrier-protein] S-malonyltransferase [Candidatus Thermofonsia Clade 1 bacterium]
MIDWSRTALLFPGQGSQAAGMALSFRRSYARAAEIFDIADQIYGERFSDLFEDAAALDQTENTQPALYIAGMAALRALESAMKDGAPITPLAAAGHSLGEFTALTAADALSLEDGLRLVRLRGQLMAQAGAARRGAMAALLGAELPDAQAICEAASTEAEPVVVANDNCPGQIVISGAESAVERALALAKERGIKRAVKLAVSVAAHSPLMESAAEAFRRALESVTFRAPRFPVIGNTTATPLSTPEAIMAELSAQLTGRVRWTETVRALREMGAQTFLELGSKDVLVGLLKRIDREAEGVRIDDLISLATFVERTRAN